MNLAQVLHNLSRIGLRGEARCTQNPDYMRVFVLDSEGVTVGRITMFQGTYNHFKWYGSKIAWGTEPLLPNERIPYMWQGVAQYDRVITDEEWNAALEEGWRLARKSYEEKLAWREANPPKKKRGRLDPPNPRRYLGQLLFATDHKTQEEPTQ